MKNLFVSLSPDQQKAILEYKGPELVGEEKVLEKESIAMISFDEIMEILSKVQTGHMSCRYAAKFILNMIYGEKYYES